MVYDVQYDLIKGIVSGEVAISSFWLDFIGPLFINTVLDKTHYRLKDATGLLLDGMYHVNCIKKGSAHTLQDIVSTFDGYEKALKNILLNKFAIKTPDNKIKQVILEDGSKELNYLPGTYRLCLNLWLKEV